MRIIGVIDLLGGRAVHAQGGCRLGYRPVSTAAGERVDGDAARLSRVYAERLGIREVYVADLSAIDGGSEQRDAVRAVAATGVDVWLDAGVSTVAQADRAAASGAAWIIAGLETLSSLDALRDIVAASARPVAFSLDLRNGRAVAADAGLRELTPETLAQRAVEAGAAAVIVLELDRIGSGRGVDPELMARVRRAVPDALLLAGGGVRDAHDLESLAAAGCDGTLVATALLRGTLVMGPPEGGHYVST